MEFRQQSLTLLKINYKIVTLLIFLLTVSLNERSAAESPPETFSAEECLTLAKKHFKPYQIAVKQVRLADQKIRESRVELFPSTQIEAEEIEGSTIGENFRGRGIKLKVDHPLWDGGQSWKRYKQSKQIREIALLNLKLTEDNLNLKVRQTFSSLSRAGINLSLRENCLNTIRPVYQTAKKRIENNLIHEAEWLTIKKLWSETKILLESAKQEHALASLSLRHILQTKKVPAIQAGQEIITVDLKLSLEESVQKAFELRPEIKIARLEHRLALYENEITNALSGIQIRLTGSLGSRAEAFDSEALEYEEEFFAGIRGSIPFWGHKIESNTLFQDTVPAAGQTTSTDFKSQTVTLDFFAAKNKSNKMEAQIRIQKALENKLKTEQKVEYEVTEAFYHLKRSLLRTKQRKLNLKWHQKEVEWLKLQSSLDKAPLSRYLEALIRQTDAEIKLNNSLHLYNLAAAGYRKAIGENF